MQRSSPPNVLIIRLSALGDVIQALPVLHWVRQANPESSIGWIVEADAAPLLEGHPAIDTLHVSYRKRWLKELRSPKNWPGTFGEIGRFFAGIRSVGYDLGLDTQGLLKSAMTLWLTGIKRRIGFVEAREGATLLYTQSVTLSDSFFNLETPIVNHYRTLLNSAGLDTGEVAYPMAPVPAEVIDSVSDLLNPLADLNQPLLVLAPATQWASKHWPVFYWAELIRALLRETSCNVVMIGGPKEKALVQSIVDLVPDRLTKGRLLNASGKTSLKELQALLERAEMTIGSDSAPLHLAGAVGCPSVIGLYGPTSTQRTPPPQTRPDQVILLTTPESLPCQPCDKTQCVPGTLDCMFGLTPAHVMTVVQARLRQRDATEQATLL